MDIKFVNVHEHDLYIAISEKKENEKIYKMSEYKELKVKEEMNISLINKYYCVKCKTCSQSFVKSNKSQMLYISKDNIKGLINSYNEKGLIESVYFEDRKGINLIKDKNYFLEEFYKINFEPIFDDNTIYLGTEEEKKNYFHKKFLEFKEKSELNEEEYKKNKKNLEEGKKELKLYKEGILFKEQINEKEGKYDIVIDINSILSLNDKGWKIKYPIGKEDYEKKSKNETITIGVLGNRNKGKSFILAKLSGYQIHQGFSLKTEGISVKFSDSKDYFLTILDSAGQEVPLLNSENIQKLDVKENKDKINKNNEIKEIKEEIKENDEIKENKKDDNNFNLIEENKKNQNNIKESNYNDSLLETCLRDKLVTEKFIEDFIISYSNILVLVVGSITLNEQKLMKRIKNSLKEKQELFVIHNLQNCYKKEQVDDYIENTLKKLFGLKIQENNFFDIDKNLYQKYYIETDKDVTHLIFVNDYCDIAEYYNKAAYEFIKSKLKGVRERTYFSVVEKCKEFFIEKHDRFLLETINEENLCQDDKNDTLIIKNKKIELKKVYIDEIGETVFNDSDIPNYNYYTQNNDLIVNVELPGPETEIKTKCLLQGGFFVFYFEGNKADFNSKIKKEEVKISKNLKSPTKFRFKFRLSTNEIQLKQNDRGNYNFYERTENKKSANGVYTFKYHMIDTSVTDGFE